MATAPYKLNDRRGLGYYWQTNQLIQAAIQNTQRANVPLLDYDFTRNVSSYGRRVLMSMGRYLYENFGPIRGALDEMSRFAVGTWIAQYEGRNVAWGTQAEAWLTENDKWIDMRGWPFCMSSILSNTVTALNRDGEIGILFTEDAAGNPKLQLIPSHRIGLGLNEQVGLRVKYNPAQVLPDGTVLDGDGEIVGNMAWEGLALIDGVILDDFGTPKAYRCNFGNPGLSVKFRDISANDMLLVFEPRYPDQVRGVSALSVGAFDCLDIKDSRRYEMFAQLINASYAMAIHTETGDVDTAKTVITSPVTTPDSTTGAAQDLPTQLLQPGTIAYFRANSGQKIEPLSNDRPSVNVMNFQAELMRSALAGIGWNIDFSLDASKVGGAPMRVIVEKINARVKELRSRIVAPMRTRIDGWRISKAIKTGFLPADVDWWKWSYQGPADLTADAKYDSDIDIAEFRAGISTMKDICAKRGQYWEDVMDQRINEEARFQAQCKAAKVDPNRVMLLTPNGNAAIDAQSTPANDDPKAA